MEAPKEAVSVPLILRMLPPETLMKIIRELTIKELLTASVACRTFKFLCSEKVLWKEKVTKKIEAELIPNGVLNYRQFFLDYCLLNPARAAVCVYEIFHTVINKDLIPERSFIPGEANFELVRYMLRHIQGLGQKLGCKTDTHVPAMKAFFSENLSNISLDEECSYPAEIFWIVTAILNFPAISQPWIIARSNGECTGMDITRSLKSAAEELYKNFNGLLSTIRMEPECIMPPVPSVPATEEKVEQAHVESFNDEDSEFDSTFDTTTDDLGEDNTDLQDGFTDSADLQNPVVKAEADEPVRIVDELKLSDLKMKFGNFHQSWDHFINILSIESKNNRAWQHISRNGGQFIDEGNLNSYYENKTYAKKRLWALHFFHVLEGMFSNINQRHNLIGFRAKFLNLSKEQLAIAEKNDKFIGDVLRIFGHMKQDLPK